MNWDPSMATTSCSVCSKSVEAWVNTCDDCIEKVCEALDSIEEFEADFHSLVQKSIDLHKKINKLNIHETANSNSRFNDYLIRRLVSFQEGSELFKTDDLKQPLKEINGEE